MGTGTTSPAEAGKSAEERCEAPSSSQHYAHPLYTTQNNTHTHTQHTFIGPLSRTTRVSRYRKVKPILIVLKQETESGISWAICKSTPRSRQITTPAPHRSSFLQTGCPSWCPTNSVKALKAYQTKQQHNRHYQATLHACSAQLQPIVTHAAWSWSVCMSVGHNLRHTKKRMNRSKCHLGWNQVGPINHIGPNPPRERAIWGESCWPVVKYRECLVWGRYSRSHSICGRSDVDFCYQDCSNFSSN